MSEAQENKTGQKNQIIGKAMWLITKADVRYEGVLFEVDKVNKTMSLKQVKNMGTEGRRNGVNELQPDGKVLGTVKFRVDLIKNFKIIEGQDDEDEQTQQKEPVDEAIVESEE